MEHTCVPIPTEAVHLGPLLGRAAHLARERMDVRLSGYDVTPAQTHALLYLCRGGDAVPQRDVVAHLRVKPSTANGILDRMEEKGLIARETDPTDLRQKRVRATEKGIQLKTRMQSAFQETERIIFRGMTPEESDALQRLLYRVIENLEEDRTPC